MNQNTGNATVEPKMQECVNEIRAVCNKYGLLMVGVCGDESIFGEIMLVDPASSSEYRMTNIRDEKRVSNIVEVDRDGDFVVLGIGDVR